MNIDLSELIEQIKERLFESEEEECKRDIIG